MHRITSPNTRWAVALALAALLSAANAAQDRGGITGCVTAQDRGGITGCVTDMAGEPLPGTKIVATSSATAEQVAVTDPSGCYEIADLAAGTYTLTADLAGFVAKRHERVSVQQGLVTRRVNFALCTGALYHIDWIHPGGLEQAWQEADAVVYIRIVATRPRQAECPTGQVVHTATVLEVLKDMQRRPLGRTLTLFQEQWENEPRPYRTGQELVVFLTFTPGGFVRTVGPFYTFLMNGTRVVSVNSQVRTEGVKPKDFLARLRKLGR